MFGLSPFSAAAFSALDGQARASAVAESTTVADTAFSASAFLASISDALQVIDASSAAAAFAVLIAETSTAQDQALIAPSVFNAVALAAAQVAESFSPAGSIYNAALPIQGAGALDSLRRAKLRTVFIDDFVYTGADTTALTVDATVSGNTASGTVESGQITATVLP